MKFKKKRKLKKNKTLIIALLGAGAVCAGVVSWAGSGGAPVVTAEEAKVAMSEENVEDLLELPEKERQQKLRSYATALATNRNTPPSREEREKMRKVMQKLSPEDRRAFGQGMRKAFRERMDNKIAAFFKASAEEQERMLEEEVERMRKFHEQRKKGRGPEGEKPPNDGKGPKDGKDKGRRRHKPTREQRENRMRDRLNDHSPTERAQHQEYFRRMREKMESKRK